MFVVTAIHFHLSVSNPFDGSNAESQALSELHENVPLVTR